MYGEENSTLICWCQTFTILRDAWIFVKLSTSLTSDGLISSIVHHEQTPIIRRWQVFAQMIPLWSPTIFTFFPTFTVNDWRPILNNHHHRQHFQKFEKLSHFSYQNVIWWNVFSFGNSILIGNNSWKINLINVILSWKLLKFSWIDESD